MFFKFIKEQIRFKFSYLLCAAIGFILLNLFWLVASHWIFVFRPYMNYDYGLALMLAPISWILCVLGLLFFYAAELLIMNSVIFHFASVGDFFKSSEFASELKIEDFLNVQDVGMFAAFLVLSILVVRFLKKRTNALAVVLVVILAFGADQLNGSSYQRKSDAQIIEGNLSGSSLLKIYTSFKEVKSAQENSTPAQAIEAQELPLTAAQISTWADAHPDKSILYLIVESYGLSKIAALNEWHNQHLSRALSEGAYAMRTGAAKHVGATTAAELRHLCGLKGSYSSRLSEEDLPNCLPHILLQKGYPTIGAHGFTGHMFYRNIWWPKIGLEDVVFIQDYQNMGAPFCGSGLYGVCDDFIIRDLGQRIEQQKGFYYHLTLNTHLPVARTEVPADLQEICRVHDLPDQVCALHAKVGEYLGAVTDMLNGLENKPLVFIVGDHMPPFSDKAARRSYIGGETPYFILEPQ